MSATHDHCTALLAAAARQDRAAAKNAAADAMGALTKAEQQELIRRLAWAAGVMARRLPGGMGADLLTELAIGGEVLERQNPFVRPGGVR